MLDALDLLDDSRVKGRDSRYAGYFLNQLAQKGESQVLNRSELIGGEIDAEADLHFGLESEWVTVTLLGLVYTGEITLALPGRKIDAGNLEETVKIGIADLANWKFIGRPKGLPLAALTELFQLLELPIGLIKDANQHVSAVEQLQKRVAGELDRLVLARQKAQAGLPVWEANLLEGQTKAGLLRRLDAHKTFLESLQTYNTPGKLRNFRYSADEVKGQAAGRALVADLEAVAEVVAAIQPLTAYVGVAMAVLPSTGPCVLGPQDQGLCPRAKGLRAGPCRSRVVAEGGGVKKGTTGPTAGTRELASTHTARLAEQRAGEPKERVHPGLSESTPPRATQRCRGRPKEAADGRPAPQAIDRPGSD